MSSKHIPYNNNHGRYVKYVPSQNFNPHGSTLDGNRAYVIGAPASTGFGCSDCSYPGIHSSTNSYIGSKALLERPGLGVDPFLLKQIDQIENQHVEELENLRRDYEKGLLEIERENHRKEVEALQDKIHQLQQELLLRKAQPTSAPSSSPIIFNPSSNAPSNPAPAPIIVPNEHLNCNFNNSERIIALNQLVSQLEAQISQQKEINDEQKKNKKNQYKEKERELTEKLEELKGALDDALDEQQERDKRDLARETQVQSLNKALSDLDRQNRELGELLRLQDLENQDLLARVNVLDGDLRNLRITSPRGSPPRNLPTLSPQRVITPDMITPYPPYIGNQSYPNYIPPVNSYYRAPYQSPLRSTRIPDDPYRHLNGYERPRDSQVLQNRSIRRNE